MIVDLLLGLGRFVDKLLGHDRPARSSLSAWRIPLQLPEGDGPWAYEPPEVPEDLAAVSIVDDEPPMLSAHEAAELAESDAVAQQRPHLV